MRKRTVFFSYSRRDEELRNELEKHLSMLKREGFIDTWHDRLIPEGDDFAEAIDQRINTDDIILLLVSADFIQSKYCYEIEMTRALERDGKGAVVIPVILRPCDWKSAPFGKLNHVPRGEKAITQFENRDEALLNVAEAVRRAVNRLNKEASKEEEKPRTTKEKNIGSGSNFTWRTVNLVILIFIFVSVAYFLAYRPWNIQWPCLWCKDYPDRKTFTVYLHYQDNAQDSRAFQTQVNDKLKSAGYTVAPPSFNDQIDSQACNRRNGPHIDYFGQPGSNSQPQSSAAEDVAALLNRLASGSGLCAFWVRNDGMPGRADKNQSQVIAVWF